jgi:hypothetical protein
MPAFPRVLLLLSQELVSLLRVNGQPGHSPAFPMDVLRCVAITIVDGSSGPTCPLALPKLLFAVNVATA